MKKILFLTIDFPPMGGGMSRHSYDAALALKEVGKDVVVLAPGIECDSKEFKLNPEITILRLKNLVAGKIFDSYIRSVMAFFQRSFSYRVTHKVRAIVVNTWTVVGVAALFLRKTLGIPYFVFAHGLDVYQPRNSKKVTLMMKLVFKNASMIFANSNFTKSLLQNIVPLEKIAVLHPVFDPARFAQTEIRLSDKLKGKAIILTVGRLVESKGHESVIRAFPKVLKQFPETVYQIVGDGPREVFLKELVEELGLTDKVIFEGRVEDEALPCYYQNCDIFVLISKEIPERGEAEGFGIVFLEAGFCAKPVIGGKSGGIPDAIEEGVTGLLVDPDNSVEIAEAITKLLLDTEMRKRLGEAGKRRVEEEFNRYRLGEKLGKIING